MAQTPPLFRLFNEIGIIDQLASALFQAHLPAGILVTHFSVLNHLVRVRDGATPLQLARAFQVPKTSMTHTLSGLVRNGWVEMRANPDDARSKQVWLTEQGRAFRDRAIASVGPEIDRIEAALPGLAEAMLPQLETLRRFLDRDRESDP